MRSRLPAMLAAAAMASAASVSLGAYTNNFESDTSANWTVNTSTGTDSAANFFFDYSTAGIPAAPSGAGTHGAKLQANQSSSVFGGMSASPNGVDLGAGDYRVTFDWWANFNGPFPVGGSGSTQLSTFGVGTGSATAQWPGAPVQESVWFGATGDGNSSSDWRAYSSAAPTRYTDDSGVYAAGSDPGSSNASNAYYAGFGGVSAPAAQLALFPQQSGTTGTGAAGMEWHQVEIERIGNNITWTVDGLLIATIDATTVTLGGSNMFIGHSDTNTSSSTDPNDSALLFTLIDNVQVVPEPMGLAALGLAGLGAFARRRA